MPAAEKEITPMKAPTAIPILLIRVCIAKQMHQLVLDAAHIHGSGDNQYLGLLHNNLLTGLRSEIFSLPVSVKCPAGDHTHNSRYFVFCPAQHIPAGKFCKKSVTAIQHGIFQPLQQILCKSLCMSNGFVHVPVSRNEWDSH